MNRSSLGLGVLGIASAVIAFASCSSDPAAPAGRGGATGSSSSGAGGAGGTGGATTSSSSTGSGGAGGAAHPLTPKFTVTGVVTDGTNPLPGAIVMQGGGKVPMTTTGPDGTYSIELTDAIPAIPTVVASKLGYRTHGVEFYFLPDGPVEIALRFVTPPDNTTYIYGDPGTGDPAHDNSTLYCGHCHTTEVKEFQGSGHAEATKNPILQDLYAGVTEAATDAPSCAALGGTWRAGLVPGAPTTSMPKCYVGGGVLSDLNPCGAPGAKACDDPSLPAAQKPTAFGRCADCHAAGLNGKGGGRDLHEAEGIAFDNGNHCDVCHHARDVDLTKPSGVAGRLVLQRPSDKYEDVPLGKLVQVLYGPLADVPNEFMGGSWQPLYSTSKFCAGCHEQEQDSLVPGQSIDKARWPLGLPTHSTYTEWLGSAWEKAGTHCQHCHMPPSVGLKSTLDVTDETNASITFGFVRPADQMRQHVFTNPLDGSPRLLDGAVSIALSATPSGATLNVGATLVNVQAGHAMPTGEPMRAMLLVVRAEACGAPIPPSGGMTLNDVGGAAVEGVVGAGATFAGATLTWAKGAARAKTGDAVRVVRPTGAFDDYDGIGLFAGSGLTPQQKGLELRTPVGEALVVSTAGAALTLSAPIAAQPGDLVYLGDALAADPVDGDASRALAGAAGYAFARVLVDGAGARRVPHYRAVDIASDNRLGAAATAKTSHAFAIPPGCASATLTATALYRPFPVEMARLRGWTDDGKDYVIATTTTMVPLP